MAPTSPRRPCGDANRGTEPEEEITGGSGEVGGYNKEGGGKEMALPPPPTTSGNSPAMLHRSGSRPQLDLSGAAIQGNLEERNPTILLPNQSDDISHLAVDIGG